MSLNNLRFTKLFTIGLTVLLLTSFGVAVEGFNGDKSQPHITIQPDEAPGNVTQNTTFPGLPDLPGDASETAGKVLDAISNNLQNGLDNIGETLQNLLGQNNTQG